MKSYTTLTIYSINKGKVSKWDTSNVTNMILMFNCCSSLNSLPDISKWNTSKVTNMESMFNGCSNLKNIPTKFIK